MKLRIFVICPVRNVPEETNKKISAYIAKLEAEGNEVYWPYRDNPYQKTDKIGTAICEYNLKKMLWADEVRIWYDKNSTGSVFDIGMFLMFTYICGFKKFDIINREDIAPTPNKSFENVILALREHSADGLKERWARHGK